MPLSPAPVGEPPQIVQTAQKEPLGRNIQLNRPRLCGQHKKSP